MDSQTRMRRSTSLSRQLHRAGLGVLAVFVITVVSALLPLRPTEPTWQLQISAALINNGTVGLLGLLLVALASWLDPKDDRLQQRHALLRRLALAAVAGYLLLIPMQTMALWRALAQGKQQQILQRKTAEARIQALEKAASTAQTPAELQSQLQRLPGSPQLSSAQLTEPMPQLRQRITTALAFARSRLRASTNEPSPAQVQKWIQESVRISLSALALAFAFAAGAQFKERGWGPSLLDDVADARQSAQRRGHRR